MGERFKLRILREKCKDCVEGVRAATRCDDQDCALWDYRTGHRPKGYKATRTPLKALRAFCLWCCCGQKKEVRLCPAYGCPLWPWRMGRGTGQERPKHTETGGARADSRGATEARDPEAAQEGESRE